MQEKPTQSVYLDYAAATPLDPEVFAVMEPWLRTQYANPSATYRSAREARMAIDAARHTVAQVVGCTPQEILFTAGGTESDNIAIQGACASADAGEIVTTGMEHAAVTETVQAMTQQRPSFTARVIAPTTEGMVVPETIAQALSPQTRLVSVILVSHEVGTIQSIADIVSRVHAYNSKILFHTDACQATAYLDIDVAKLGVDLMSINASKIYGPKGVGALYIRSGVVLSPTQHGGGQERGMRPGTENVAGIIGFAKAVELAHARRSHESARVAALRDQLQQGILDAIPGTRVNGALHNRLPNMLNMQFPDVDGEALLFALDQQGIAASMGSACAAGSIDPSPVLLAMGLSKKEARSSIRFTLGKNTTQEEIEYVLKCLPQLVAQVHSSVD